MIIMDKFELRCLVNIMMSLNCILYRSRWPCSVGSSSAAASLLDLGVVVGVCCALCR